MVHGKGSRGGGGSHGHVSGGCRSGSGSGIAGKRTAIATSKVRSSVDWDSQSGPVEASPLDCVEGCLGICDSCCCCCCLPRGRRPLFHLRRCLSLHRGNRSIVRPHYWDESEATRPSSAVETACRLLFWSFVIWVALSIAVAEDDVSRGLEDTFTLHGGEMRRVPLPRSGGIFTKNVIVTQQRPVSDISLVVYHYPKGCPKLTGATDIRATTHDVNLAKKGDCDYDSFYLNAGSEIKVNATAAEGSARVVMLHSQRGYHQWMAKRTNPNIHFWSDLSVPISNASLASKACPSAQLMHSIRGSVSGKTDGDDYFVVIESTSKDFVGTLGVEVNAATYDVSDMQDLHVVSPVTAAKHHVTDVPLKLFEKESGCLIVKASETTSDIGDKGDITVSVAFEGRVVVMLLAVASIIVAALFKKRSGGAKKGKSSPKPSYKYLPDVDDTCIELEADIELSETTQ